jgi:SagB-type dehydrogenase family enzyme
MIDQAYRKINSLLDQVAYRETCEFHAKTNNFFLTNASTRSLHPQKNQDIIQEMEYLDIPISPFNAQRVDLSDSVLVKKFPQRQKSATAFTAEQIPLIDLFTLLQQAFGDHDSTQASLRPYPSGGALYSVQVIVGIRSSRILSDSSPTSNLSTGFYHYRPSLHALDFLKPVNDERLVDLFFNQEDKKRFDGFNFCLIYTSFLAKAMFKYSYRGYRLALLEAGSMYQQASLCGNVLRLTDRVWSYFEDYTLCKVSDYIL